MDTLPSTVYLQSADSRLTADIPESSPFSDVKAICVIGCGPTGLAALKVITEAPQYKSSLWTVTAFEARDNVGGIWLPAPPTTPPKGDPPLTPMYDSLTTNLPHPIMSEPNFPFPPSTPVFPTAAVVQSYHEAYRDNFNLSQHIQLKTGVEDVQWNEPKWKVRISTGVTHDFDFVVVANGHYRVPRYPEPEVPGLKKWRDDGRAFHSAWYRRPTDLGATILVVGGGSSGKDIAAELSLGPFAKTVIHSIPGASPEDIGKLKRRGRVSAFSDDGQVTFEDGRIEKGIDKCILATGFDYSFPFFSNTTIRTELPPTVPPLPKDLFNSKYHVFPLAKHLFPLQTHFPPKSIAFMGLLAKVVPFPLAEAQARAVVKVISDPDSLDIAKEAQDIIARYETLRGEVGDSPLSIAKAWHQFKETEQFAYRDELYAFAGLPERMKEWEAEMYAEKLLLRTVWRELEKTGEAKEWVKDVGKKGMGEWVEVMRKMLKRGREKQAKL